MAERFALVKTKRSSRKQNEDWFHYVKLKVYDVGRRSVERHYIEDQSRDLLCFFKVDFILAKQVVYLAYCNNSDFRVFSYDYRSKTLSLVSRCEVRISLNLDDIDSHTFMTQDGLLVFGNRVQFIDFADSVYIDLGAFGSTELWLNQLPASFTGACYRNGCVCLVYNGNYSCFEYSESVPQFSFFYPLDADRIVRIGGKVYSKAAIFSSWSRQNAQKYQDYEKPQALMDILDSSSGQLISSYYMPEEGVVSNALRYGNFVYFLWQLKNYAMRLNINTLSMMVCFDGDYFMECFKVVYLHRHRKLRLPLGLVREVCSFLAESKTIARLIASREIS